MTQNKVALYKAVREDANTRMANALKDKELGIKKDLGYKKFGTDVANAAIKAVPTIGSAIAAGIAANDPEWYKRVDGIIEPLCKAQFFDVLGNVHDLGYDPENTNNSVYASSPSFAIIHFVPSIGTLFRGSLVSGETQPLPITNNAFTVNAKKVIAGLVSKSGIFSSGIDPQDVLAAVSCMVDLWSFIHTFKRFIACVDMYSEENRTLPRYLAGAILGINRPLTDAEMTNAQFYRLNMISAVNALIAGANTMNLPKQLTLINRRLFLADALVYDDDKKFNQLYGYKQDAYLKWSDTITIHGHYTQVTGQKWMNDNVSGALVSIGTTPIPEYLMKFGSDLLNALVNSQDITIINGAFLKFFKNDSDYYREPAYPTEGRVELIGFFDYMAASQIRNTKFVGPITMNNVWGITLQEFDDQAGTYAQILEVQSTYNDYYFLKTGNVSNSDIVLNSKGDDVTADEVAEMTRNCSYIHRVPVYTSGGTSTYIHLAAGGSEVFTYMSLVANTGVIEDAKRTDPTGLYTLDGYIELRWTGASVTAYTGGGGTLSSDIDAGGIDYMFRHLKNCPFGFAYVECSLAQAGKVALWMGDPIENACAISVANLNRIHDAAVYSEIYLEMNASD